MMISLVIKLSAVLVLALMFYYLYKSERKNCTGIWAFGWFVYLLGPASDFLMLAGHKSADFLVGNHLSALFSGFLLLCGIYSCREKAIPEWCLFVFAPASLLTAATGLWLFSFRFFTFFTLPLFILVYVLIGLEFYRLEYIKGAGKYFAGWTFISWGIYNAVYPFLQPVAWFTPWSYLIDTVLALTASFGLLYVYFKKMSEGEKHFRQLADNARDVIYRYREAPVPGFDYVSPAIFAITGYTPEECYADPDFYIKLIHPEDRPLLEAMRMSNGIFNEAVVLKWVRKDGKSIWIEQRNAPVCDESGNLVAIQGIARDITEHKRTEKVFKLTEDRLRTAYQHVVNIIEFLPDATFVIDRERKVIAWNRAMEEMTGVPKKYIIGKGNCEYAVPFHGTAKPMLIDSILLDKGDNGLKNNKTESVRDTLVTEIFAPGLYNGNGAFLWSTASPLYDEQGNPVGAIESLRDITERKVMEKKLKYLSTQDVLTGLFNRFYFEDELRRLEDGLYDPVGLIICDADGLKLVNDTLGHKAGDKMLVAIANILNRSIGKEAVVARIGGDEFAVLLHKTSRTEVENACRRIRDAAAECYPGESEIPLSLSLGFAVRDDSSISLGEIFKEADNNMYREKLHSGKSARSAIVKSLMKMLETRDYITEGHGDRLQDLIVDLARAAGLPEFRMNDMRLLAHFHDIGKVGIPDKILFKTGSLTHDGELPEMKRHCEIGYRIAQSVPDMLPVADWILKHHEWWNGEGYPLGLKGEDIPLECRILAIVDAYDAMTNDRPYRKAMSHWLALVELKRCAGTQFDPRLVSMFLKLGRITSCELEAQNAGI